jgi:hypothetical protein
MTAAPDSNLRALLDGLHCGAPVPLGPLTLVPLVGDICGPSVLTLSEALAGGLVVTELDASGTVNRVRAHNPLDQPVLLLDGDELIGAKQNRVLNASVLLGPRSESVLDVSCVERGRWRWGSNQFRAEERTVQTTLRSHKAHRVARSLFATGRYDADQGAVWRDVATITSTRRATSKTGSLSDVLAADRARIDASVEAIAAVPGQVGLATVHGADLVGVDLLGSPELYARCHERLVRGLAAEALLRPPAEPHAAIEPLQTLRTVLAVAPMTHSSGAGVEERFHGPAGTAAALFLDHQLVHLSAFPPPAGA